MRRTSIQVERQATTMGQWEMARWTPTDLREAIEEVWCFDGDFRGMRECHFPSGNVEVVVHLNQVYHMASEDSGPLPRLNVSGQLMRPLVIEAPAGQIAAVGIRLRPAGAFALLGHPLDSITGRTVDLTDVIPAASELEDRCREARSLAQRVRAATDWVRERLAGATAPDPDVAWAVNEITRTDGGLPIERLTRQIGRARSSFTHAFREQVGVTPKSFARIRRFRNALRLVSVRMDPLVDVALRCGYYDQAHLNRDFRAFSGLTPTQYGQGSRFPESESTVAPLPDGGV